MTSKWSYHITRNWLLWQSTISITFEMRVGLRSILGNFKAEGCMMSASQIHAAFLTRPVRTARKLLIFAFFCSLFSPRVAAQQSSPQTIADELFAHSDWQKAAQAYSDLTASDPKNGLAWQNLGECFLELHKYEQAVQAFAAASDLNFRPLVNKVNVARAYAEKGDRDGAMKALGEVVASGQGGRVRPFILGSSEFARLRDDAQFKSILEAIAPCKSAEFRQFDFWVGDWEVQDPAGKVVGQNLVTLEQDGCLIIEHWKDASGVQTGTSFNYYDIRDKMWHQLYLDNSGNAGAFPAMAGNLIGGKMMLLTDERNTPLYRWSWYTLAPDHVRQMAEQSSDGQKTWQIFWDSVYVRKAAQQTK
jgi:tetratricopeptide (TPR) repeat protein